MKGDKRRNGGEESNAKKPVHATPGPDEKRLNNNSSSNGVGRLSLARPLRLVRLGASPL